MLAELKKTASDDRRVVGQMLRKWPLVDYLRKGLAKLRAGVHLAPRTS